MKKIIFFQKVIKIIGFSNGTSKKEIAKELDLTTAGIAKVINEMVEMGLIVEKEYGESTGGRKPIIYSVSEKKIGKILGINLAPQKMEIIISDIYGQGLKKKELKISQKENLLENLDDAIKKEIKNNKDICILSFVVNGLVDSENGISLFSPHYKWKNLNLKKYFEGKYSLPVVVENDVRAMALVEKIFGDCQNTKNFVVLNISEGIGAGIYIDDSLYSGNNFIAGEIGHITVDRASKRKCSCGKFGCLEAEASNLAIIDKTKQAKIFQEEAKTEKENYKELNIKKIISELKSGNKNILNIINDVTNKIGIGIDIIISILNPEKIILVNEFLKEKIIFEKLLDNVAKITLSEQKCEIIKSKFQEDIGIYSTIALVNYKLYKDEKLLKKIIKHGRMVN